MTRWLKRRATRSRSTSRCSRSPPTRSTPRSRRPVAGTVQQILVGEDETVAVGAELAVIGRRRPAAEPPRRRSRPAAPAGPAAAAAGTGTRAPAAAAPAAPRSRRPGSRDRHRARRRPSPQHAPRRSPARAGRSAEPAGPPPAPAQAARRPRRAPAAGASGTRTAAVDASAYVTPLVRKLAAEHGVDLAQLTGTGVGGRIRKQDVLDAAEAAKAAAAAGRRRAAPAPAARRPLAARRAAVDASAARHHREDDPAAQGDRPADGRVAAGLGPADHGGRGRRHQDRPAARARPSASSRPARASSCRSCRSSRWPPSRRSRSTRWSTPASTDDEIIYHAQENLGIAVDTERGLLVPVIQDAGDLNIAGLARKIADLAERTRTNKIAPDELGGGTFTLTNTGSRGALFDTPIINQPQVGDPRHRRGRQAPGRRHRPRRRRDDRDPLDGLPGADLRPPARRRRGRRPLPRRR